MMGLKKNLKNIRKFKENLRLIKCFPLNINNIQVKNIIKLC